MICAFFFCVKVKNILKKLWNKSVRFFKKKYVRYPPTYEPDHLCLVFKSCMVVPESLLVVLYNSNFLVSSVSLWFRTLNSQISTSTASLDIEIPALTSVALFKLYCAQDSCQTTGSDSGGLKWDWRVYTFNKFSDDISAAYLGAALE